MRFFGLESGKVIGIDPVGTATGFINTELVKLQVKSGAKRPLLDTILCAGLARHIGQALLDAADEGDPGGNSRGTT